MLKNPLICCLSLMATCCAELFGVSSSATVEASLGGAGSEVNWRAVRGQQEDETRESQGRGFLIRVELPITGGSAATVERNLARLIDEADGGAVDQRPIVVLEFATDLGKTGQGSSLGACIDLARFLTGLEASRLRTVAFLPPSRRADLDADDGSRGKLVGHAVLVALACQRLAIAKNVSIGSAGIDEDAVDAFVAEAYRGVVAMRSTIPVPVAMAMLDRRRELFRILTRNGPIFADRGELEQMESVGEAENAKTLSPVGEMAIVNGQQLVDLGLLREATQSRAQLQRQLKLPADSLKPSRSGGDAFRAIQISLPDYVDASSLQWIARSLESRRPGDDFNLLLVRIDSSGGDVEACLQMARRLAGFRPEQVRTVAYVDGEAVGPAALIAMACQHVILQQNATIGGNFEPPIDPDSLEDLKSAAAGMAESLDKAPASLQAMLDPMMDVVRFRDKSTGEQRLMTQPERDELADAENWLPQGPFDMFEPISAIQAFRNDIARQVVSGEEELQTMYQLEADPELLEPTDVDRWLHRVGMFLASPFVAPWLLFGAMFFLFNEVSQPGLGVPGFLGTVCLILYFWSQHLGGNANWLEILLFAAGALFIVIELFVVPGFGIFGIGGLTMVVASIVLASQTFVFPTTTEEFNQLPKSLFALVGAIGGLIFALVVLRSVLPNTPFFKKIMLEPPAVAEHEVDGHFDRQSAGTWNHLVGQTGAAFTNLVPAGKARINGELVNVISDGRLIEKGAEVEVIEVAGNRIVVTAKQQANS